MPLPALNESSRLRYVTFFYLYFMQGVPSGFALTAIANYLTGRGVAPSAVGTFVSIVGLPWILQFFWGPVIDRYQYSVIGHRKHWVVLTQAVAFVASLTLLRVHHPAAQLSLLSAVFFTHSLFASVQDASVDAMAISVMPPAERGRVNAFMRGGLLLGLSFGAAALSYVLHRYGFRTAVLVQSGLLLFFTVLTFFTKLDRRDLLLPVFASRRQGRSLPKSPPLPGVFRKLWASVTERSNLRTFGLIALMYVCFSVFIRSYSYHMIRELGWSDERFSILVGGWGSLLTFSVVVSGGYLADRIGLVRLQRSVTWALAIFLLLFNALSFLWAYKGVSVPGILFWNIADPLFSVAAFPLLMALCREDIAGSQFTAYMALINLCDVAGSYITGWALHVTAAPVLGFGCGVLMLCSVLFRRKSRQQKEGLLNATQR